MCYSSDCGSEFWSVPLLLQGHGVCYLLCFFMRVISVLYTFIFMLVISMLYTFVFMLVIPVLFQKLLLVDYAWFQLFFPFA